MIIRHLYSGDDGESHFGDLELGVDGDLLAALRDGLLPVKGLLFHEFPAGREHGYTNEPHAQVVINLSGWAELGVGGGETWTFGPGDVLLAEDTTGRGHTSRSIEGARRVVLAPLVDGFDSRPLRR